MAEQRSGTDVIVAIERATVAVYLTMPLKTRLCRGVL